MAEETKKQETPVVATEVVVPEAEKPVVVATEAEKPVAETAEAVKGEEKATDEAVVVADEKDKKIAAQVSFKEETNVVGELPESQRKALEDLKKLIQEALEKHEFATPPPPPAPSAPAKAAEEEKKKEQPESAEEKPAADEVAPAAASDVAIAAAETEQSATAATESDVVAAVETAAVSTAQSAAATTSEPAPPTKTVEAQVPTTEPPKTDLVAPPKHEEAKKEEEDIKETIVVEVTPPAPAPAPEAAPVVEPPTKEAEPVAAEPPKEPEEVSIWGIPLLADDRTDVILLKFLRARDFRVKDAFAMIRNTVRWRKEFDVDGLLNEDLGNDYEKVVFTHGYDKHGRTVCYNVFGEFQNKELYTNTFSDAEKRKNFLRWLIQFLEKTIRTLDFSPKGINSFVLVNDLKNSPGYGKRDLYKVIDKFLEILHDNYPEFAAKQLCINVSWWYLAYNWIYLTVFTPRSKSKFVFASPSKTAETLFKYIAPEQVPVQIGGHSKLGEHEFSTADPVSEVTIKPGTKHPLEFECTEGSELVWELRVIGWDVSYGAEFLPTKEGAYTLNIEKPKKVTPTDEPVICNSFKVTEPGKVVITVDNQSSKKKKLLYRSKVKGSSHQ